MKRALITGINGQDGSYLAELLLERGYESHGILKRNSVAENQTARLDDIFKDLKLEYADMLDMASLIRVLQLVQPDEIYNLAAQSHVRISFDQPIYTTQVVGLGVLNLLESIRLTDKNIKVYQASSSEMFGNSFDDDGFQRETTPMHPTSPYGCAKVYAYNICCNYRNAYDMYISNGILFNHESPLRSNEFVTKKIINHCKLIKKGKLKYLYLGDINIYRDWGWAPEYVEAMYLMLKQKNPKDLVIGSGKKHSLRNFVYEVFRLLKIPRKHLKLNTKKLMRKKDIRSYQADPRLAKKVLNWKAKTTFKQMIYKMVKGQLY